VYDGGWLRQAKIVNRYRLFRFASSVWLTEATNFEHKK
jgi:hypothetical protein